MTMAAFSQQFYLLYHVLITISSLFVMMNLVFAGPSTGLTLKLIHRDSPESPLFPGNLTQDERIRRDFQRSKVRHQHLKVLIKSWRVRNITRHPDIAKPPVFFSPETHFYMALVGIGTFLPSRAYINYYLLVDTASDLLWVQCQGCNPCYPQVRDSYYPALSSSTYHPLPCNKHDLCETGKCEGSSCSYQVLYGDGASSYGILASETLRVHADNTLLESIDNIVFGCGSKQMNFQYYGDDHQKKTELGGMLGLGGGKKSFLRQLGDRGQMKFAYCFQLWSPNTNRYTFLRFGSDAAANIGGGGQVVQTTPMFFGRGPTVYFVNLQDISIAGIRMGFTPQDFVLKNTGTGGCVFDSGTQWTLLAPAIYDRLADDLIRYFTALDVHTTARRPDSGNYDTCFTKPNPWPTILHPSITFHFERADLEIQPEAAFYIGDDIFCFAILRDNEADDDYDDDDDEGIAVIIGAIQQANYRILYDLGTMKISWAREDCSLNQ